MDDDRIRDFERALWLGDADHYRQYVEDDCVMVVPEAPFILSGRDAIEAVADTPRWADVTLEDLTISRPEEGLIVIAYLADASKHGRPNYRARCSSTLRRSESETWRVVQHHQTAELIDR
ncbi:MAG: DUF4440 domain-containing protein [Pseudomonadota bacterium]